MFYLKLNHMAISALRVWNLRKYYVHGNKVIAIAKKQYKVRSMASLTPICCECKVILSLKIFNWPCSCRHYEPPIIQRCKVQFLFSCN